MLRAALSGYVTVALWTASLLAAGCSGPADRRADSTPAPVTDPESAATPPSGSPATGATTAMAVVVGKAPAAKGGLASIVILQPREPTPASSQATIPVMDQVSLSFTPAVLFARTGQTTEFRNSDDTLHNIRVRNEETREGTFNVALPTGGTYRHTFPSDGFYDVGCDIHPGMSAVVVATTTPYVTLAAPDGAFSIEGVPPGQYTVTIYADVRKIEQQATITPGKADLGSIDQ